MRTEIKAGAFLDAVSPTELATHLDRFTADWYQEKARGITIARFDAFGAVASTAVTVPPVGAAEPIGPFKGFAWLVHSIRVAGLATGDTISIYRNVANNNKFLGTMNFATPYISYGSKGLILLGEEKLVFTGASLTATGDITVNGEGTQCPEPDLYKLIS